MEKTGQFCFTHPSNKDVYRFRLCSINKTEVLLTNYGAILMAYKIPTRNDSVTDIVLGFDNVQDYLTPKYLKIYPFMGAAIGRYANRIKGASFAIDNRSFHLTKNWGNDQLHGGLAGFDKKVWDVINYDERNNVLQLQYLSKDGEEGFPGNLNTSIRFELTAEGDLIYEYEASCDQPTAVNLTHHSYFNLDNGAGTIHDHKVKIYSDRFLEQDSGLVATGRYLPVSETRYDFRQFRRVGDSIDDGYDQSFVVDKELAKLSVAAELSCENSGVRLQILTTEPVVHLYTGQGFPSVVGKTGRQYGEYSGLCLEMHKHPNAINIPGFPNTVIIPGQKYWQQTVYNVRHLRP